MACFLSLQLEYRKGHEERVSKYTTFVDPPEVLLAKKQGQIVSDVSFSLSHDNTIISYSMQQTSLCA